MDFIASTPYPCTTYVWRDKSGRFHRVCVMVGTFDISSNGRLSRSEFQPGPRFQTEYYGKVGASSVRYDSDLVPYKPAGEFYLADPVGEAPEGKTWRHFVAKVSLGSLTHRIKVSGPREWRCGAFGRWSLSEPDPVQEVPIQYEYAFGGSFDDAMPRNEQRYGENPVGRGYCCTKPGKWGQAQPGHQIGLDDMALKDMQMYSCDALRPAGLTPVDRGWQPRARYLGTIDDRWKENRWPLVPIDFDYRYFQASPCELQLAAGEYFKGDETFSVQSIKTPGWRSFALPDSNNYVLAAFPKRKQLILSSMVLDTVVVNTRTSTLHLTWRCSLPRVNSSCPGFITSKKVFAALRGNKMELENARPTRVET